jgi:hypothetical protein
MTSEEDEVETTDKRRCINTSCDIRSSCARFNDKDFDEEAHLFHGGLQDGTSCGSFVLRSALGRGDPDMVFTEGRKRGRRHNAHAYTSPRKEYPGAEALFGAKLASAFRGKQRAHSHQSKLGDPEPTPPTKRPDLMVSRHIHKGRNIKED